MLCYLIVIHLINLSFTEFSNKDEQTNKSETTKQTFVSQQITKFRPI